MLLFAWQFLTGHFGWLPAFHLWAGYLLLVVLTFRLLWGLVGSESARFSRMLASLRYLGGAVSDLGRRRPGYWPGHNPVGAISVLLMLVLLLGQSVTGLFVETWGEVRGPLAERIDRDLALWLRDLHSVLRWPLLALVMVHVAAGFWHLFWKHENRLGAIFFDGRLLLPHNPQIELGSNSRAAIALFICVSMVAALALLGPI